MYAQCPGCYSIYRVDSEMLAHAHGQVRCSVCELVFDALLTLRDSLEPTADPEPGANTEFEFFHAAVLDPDNDLEEAGSPAEQDEGEPESGTREESRPPRSKAPALWLAGCAILLALPAWQVVFRAPSALARYPALRPAAEALCTLAGCNLPPRQDLERIALASRDVRAHPAVDDALMVSATLVNRARFTQPFPALELRLSNLDGRLIARRRFEPAVYLPRAVTWRDGMPPGSRVSINLEVLDPGGDAVSFEFSFAPSLSMR